jgi:hypothetical protein
VGGLVFKGSRGSVLKGGGEARPVWTKRMVAAGLCWVGSGGRQQDQKDQVWYLAIRFGLFVSNVGSDPQKKKKRSRLQRE